MLESLTGILFPRSEGTCTRCPAIVSLQPDPHVSKAYAVISTDPDFGDGSIEVPIGEIEEAIKKVTDKLAPGRLISEKPIHIKVVRKDDCTFTIIDLPGTCALEYRYLVNRCALHLRSRRLACCGVRHHPHSAQW